jgi:tetratricopeptide (TPR) repeat protein
LRFNERQRAILATIAGWLGFGWALIEFSGFLVNRYAAPEWIIDAVLAGTAAFLPLVVVVSYWISEEGPMQWTLRRRWIAAGLLLAGALMIPVALMIAGGGSDAGMRSDKAASRAAAPQIVLFPFAVHSDSPDDDWLGQALPLFAEVDLMFDSRLSSVAANGSLTGQMQSIVRGFGIESLDAASPAIRLQAARSLGFHAMVGGQIRREDGRLMARIMIDRLDPDAALGPFTISAADPWELVDGVCRLIREQLADADAPGASDPAMRTFSSESESALRHYVAGVVASERDRDLASADHWFEQAIAADPGFVLAELARVRLMFQRTEFERARVAMRRIEPRFGILPERARFGAQIHLARTFGETDKVRGILALWSQRYPNDPAPQLALARMNLIDDPHDTKPWDVLRSITLEAGSVAELAALSNSMMIRGSIDDARSLALRAIKRAPADIAVLRQLAEVEQADGRHDAAMARLQSAILLRPDLLPLHREVAFLQFATGSWGQALATITEARARAGEHTAYSASLIDAEITMLVRLGRIRQANVLIEVLEAVENERLAPSQLFNRWVSLAHVRAQLVGREQAREWVFRWAPRDGEEGLPYAHALFDFVVAGDDRDPELFDSAVRRMQAMWPVSASVSGERSLGPHRALAAAWLADDDATFAALDEALRVQVVLNAANSSTIALLDHYRLHLVDQALRLERWQHARDWLAPLVIRRRGDPTVLWRHARLAAGMSDAVTARYALQSVLDAWHDADEDFAPAAEARAMAETLGMAQR